MKMDYTTLAVAVLLAAGLVYASNNDVPVLGSSIRRTIG